MTARRARPPARIAGALAGLVALAALAVGCGVAPQDDATRVDPANVPFGLLDGGTTTTAVDEGEATLIYLIADDRLVGVDRQVPDDATAGDLLGLVVAGPTDAERSLGITTAVPAGAVASADESRGVAQVDLTAAFGDVRSGEQLLALAQLVYTLTQRPGLGGVEFTLDGEPIDVTLADGTVVVGPLSRDDVADMAPG